MRNPYFSLLLTAWRYAHGKRPRYVLVYILLISGNLVLALNPLLYGRFVDALQRREMEVLNLFWLYAGCYLGLRVLEWCFQGPARVMERRLAFALSRNYLDELYRQVLHLPMQWHQEHHSGATANRIRKAYMALKEFFQTGFIYLHAFIKFFFSFGAMVYFSPWLGLVAAGIGALAVWVIFKLDKPFTRSLHEVNEGEHAVAANLADGLSNIRTVITLRLEKRMGESLLDRVAAILPAFGRNVVLNEWKWFSAYMLIGLVYAVMVVGYAYEHHTPGQTFYLGGLVTLTGFVIQFTSVFHDVAWLYTQAVEHHTHVEAARGIAEASARFGQPGTAAPLPGAWQTIRIEGLDFGYRTAGSPPARPLPGEPGLHGLSLHIHRGQRIALVGRSGSGKSTLLALLRGLYQPGPGVELAADGRRLDNWGSLAGAVTLFPQEPEVFENSILYNITLGLPYPAPEVDQVCRTACFDEVLAELPGGMAAPIREKGANLSGGQKQRLALARGILAARGSSIVLLDEPTSSLDRRTEAQVYGNLLGAFAGKTVIASLHNLHLLGHFDYVYVLQDGRIVERGTPAALREHGTVFNKLRQVQPEFRPAPADAVMHDGDSPALH